MNRWFSNYFPLLKGLQTGLLTVTGLAGYMSARCPVTHWSTMVGLLASLVLTIGGSTVLNMWFDHDIDRVMERTHHRTLAKKRIPLRNALIFGILISITGILLGFMLSRSYGVILFAGIFFDFVIYTVWLKRRTCWSIVWGGIAGGMPILAGRALGMGSIDEIGILLMVSVLFWIPTHMLTFSLRYAEDYRTAKIPTFPSTYGESATRKLIACSSILAVMAMSAASLMIGIQEGFLHLLGVLSGGLIILAFLVWIRPSNTLNFSLFKYASVYMLAAMLLLVI